MNTIQINYLAKEYELFEEYLNLGQNGKAEIHKMKILNYCKEKNIENPFSFGENGYTSLKFQSIECGEPLPSKIRPIPVKRGESNWSSAKPAICKYPGCGKSLQGKHPSAKFCGNACKQKYHRFTEEIEA